MKHPDEMSREMAEIDSAAPMGSIWRHVKSACEYTVQGHCFLEADAAPAILYAATTQDENPIWVRAASEFLDGRFTRLSN